MSTFAEKIITFCRELDFPGQLPEGISLMNPFRGNPEILSTVISFYNKYYSDNIQRHLILGINPGRFGAGVTGIPFTDTIRLHDKCGLSIKGLATYETSSVFIYEMIDEYGGPDKFYTDFFISAVCPLGFTKTGDKGREINYNYYDSRELTDTVEEFIRESLEKQLEFGIPRDICFCLGTGKNHKFLSALNNKHNYFKEVIPLEHPRFIMQYRSARKHEYIRMYLREFGRVIPAPPTNAAAR